MEQPNPDLELVMVFETDNPVLMDLAQATLEDAGVEFALSPPSSPEFGFTPILSPVSKILVAEQNSARAREVLNSLPGELEDLPGEAEEAQ